MECKRCLFTDEIAGVVIDSSGQCNYCDLHDELEAKYPISQEGFHAIVDDIKARGMGKQYDCLIGISGGCDSSYLVHLAHKHGLRALLFHFDNGWNSDVAEHNMKEIIRATGLDYVRMGLKQGMMDELNEAFLYASVSDADIPNDIAMGALMLDVAIQYGVKTILNGHSFRTEGSAPITWTYMDDRYVRSVYEAHWKEKLEGFPSMSIAKQIKASLLGIKQVRLLYYLDYDKDDVKGILKKEYKWKDYGGHHCENVYTQFVGDVLLPLKFDIDKRIVEQSAFVRSGFKTKKEAKEELAKVVKFGDIDKVVLKRLWITGSEWEEILSLPVATHKQFKTYHKTFKKMRWLIWMAVGLGLLPYTFYRKYTR